MNYNALRTPTIKDPTQNEILLVDGLRSKNEFIFRKLYGDYSAALFGIINQIVKDDEEAEDVLQETFIKISRSIHLYDANKSRLFTWMARVATNKSLDHIRSCMIRNESKKINLINLEEEDPGYASINSLNVEAIGIKQLISILNPLQKQVIDLLYFQGYTQAEVAEELNMPLGTVKTKARMAILELRGLF